MKLKTITIAVALLLLGATAAQAEPTLQVLAEAGYSNGEQAAR